MDCTENIKHIYPWFFNVKCTWMWIAPQKTYTNWSFFNLRCFSLQKSCILCIHCDYILSRKVNVFAILCIFFHRSHSHRHFSESDCVMLSPVELQHQNYACNEVFPEPTDCHAAQCPIHQRYGRLTEWWSEFMWGESIHTHSIPLYPQLVCAESLWCSHFIFHMRTEREEVTIWNLYFEQ